MQTVLGVLTLLGICLLLSIRVYKYNKKLFYIFIIGLIIRLLWGGVLEFTSLIDYASNWSDEVKFMSAGKEFANYFLGENSNFPLKSYFNAVDSFGMFLGPIMALWGKLTIIPRLLNLILGSLVILSSYKLSKVLGLNEKYALTISFLVAFMPNNIIRSGTIYRDMLIWNLVIILSYYWVKYLKSYEIKYYVFGIFTSIFLTMLRFQYAPIVAIFFCIVFIIGIFRYKIHIENIRLLELKYIFLFLIGAFMIIAVVFLVKTEIARRWGRTQLKNYLISHIEYRARGGASYLKHLQYESIMDIIKYLPIKFIHFTFGPFLWTSTSLRILASALETLINWLFFGIILFHIKRIIKFKISKEMIVIFLFGFANILAMSIIDSNYGAAMRHRMIFLPLIFITGFHLIQSSQKKRTAN